MRTTRLCKCPSLNVALKMTVGISRSVKVEDQDQDLALALDLPRSLTSLHQLLLPRQLPLRMWLRRLPPLQRVEKKVVGDVKEIKCRRGSGSLLS
jgi:hypothetical protein